MYAYEDCVVQADYTSGRGMPAAPRPYIPLKRVKMAGSVRSMEFELMRGQRRQDAEKGVRVALSYIPVSSFSYRHAVVLLDGSCQIYNILS